MEIIAQKIKIQQPLFWGQLFFNLGTFFLASALPISGIFYLFALSISFFKTKNIFKDKWNIGIIFISGLFIANTLRFYLQEINENLSYFQKSLAFINLLNWVPLFCVFILFQYYLKTSTQRKLFARFLVGGSIPVIVTCFLQHFFKIYGPFKTMGGLIIFFNKAPILDAGVTGLFSNQNYTGFWLSVTFPLIISLINKLKFNSIRIYIILTILLFTIYFIILTNSKNALVGLITSTLVIFGFKKLIILFLISLIFFQILNSLHFINPIWKLNLINHLKLNDLINIMYLENIFNFLNFTRIKIWNITLQLISQKPIFGFGAATFPIIFFNASNMKIQHAHNLPLHLAYEYGLPISILLSSFIIFLFYKSWSIIFNLKNKNLNYFFDKCWLASCLVVIFSQINDITYYDGKISLLIWILFAGLKCILEDLNYKKLNLKEIT